MIMLKIQVGDKYYIIEKRDGKVYIGNELGEAGNFDNEKLFEVIDKFFKENF